MTKLTAAALLILFSVNAHASQKIGSFTCAMFFQAANTRQTISVPVLVGDTPQEQVLYQQTLVPMNLQGQQVMIGINFTTEKSYTPSAGTAVDPVTSVLSKLDLTTLDVGVFPSNIVQLRQQAQAQPHEGEFNYAPASFETAGSTIQTDNVSRAMVTFLDIQDADRKIYDTLFVQCVRN